MTITVGTPLRRLIVARSMTHAGATPPAPGEGLPTAITGIVAVNDKGEPVDLAIFKVAGAAAAQHWPLTDRLELRNIPAEHKGRPIVTVIINVTNLDVVHEKEQGILWEEEPGLSFDEG